MKFTKGLFIGTALGMTAAMMMNNKSRGNTQSRSNFKSGSTTASETDANDYVINDII